MVKHIKKSYKKDGELTDDEKSIAYATAWKDYNKESFEINPEEHKKAKRISKIRNLAKNNKNPAEKEAAEKKAGGPKLYGEGVMDIVRKYSKKKEEKKPQKATDAGARARRVLQRKEYKSKVSSIVPAELEDHKSWINFRNDLQKD